MWPYWLFFYLFLLNALIHIGPSLLSRNGRYLIRPSLLSIKGRYWSIEWVSIFILLLFIIGLRYEVGRDWNVYLSNLEVYRLESVGMSSRDFGYHVLNWLAVKFDQEIVLVNFIAAIFFSYGLVIFCRNQALPSLSMLVAFPYLVSVVAMGYTRQSIVLGFFMLGLVALENGNYWRYIKLIIFATLFHISAVILLPLAMIVVKRYLFISDSYNLSTEEASKILSEYPRLELFRVQEGKVPNIIKDSYILFDPLGNGILIYAPELPGGELLDDLKKVLKNSKIG